MRAIDVVIENRHLIPTRTALAVEKKLGRPDLVTIEGDGIEVLAGGFRTDRFRPERLELQKHEPERLVRDAGLSGRSRLRVRWIVRGAGKATIRYAAEKAVDVERVVEIP